MDIAGKLFSKTSNLANNCDILGRPMNLTLQGKSKHQTWLGAIMSFLALGITLISAVVSFSKYVDTTTPSIRTELSTLKEYIPIDLLKNEIFFVIGYGLYMNDDRIILPEFRNRATIKSAMIKTMGINIVNGIPIITYEKPELNMKKCGDLPENNPVKKMYKGEDDNNLIDKVAFCPQPDPSLEQDYVLKENPAVIGYSALSFLVLPCTLPNGIGCLPPSLLQRDALFLGYPEFFTENSKKKDFLFGPMRIYDDIIILDTVKSIRLQMIKVEVYDIENSFLGPKLVKTYYEFNRISRKTSGRNPAQTTCDPSKDLFDEANCVPYLKVNVFTSTQVKRVYRTYVSLFTIISEIGGFSKIAILTFALIYSVYNGYQMRKFLNQKIFDLDKEKRLTKPQIKKMKKITEESMDLITMMKNSHKNKVISDLYFKDYHKKLLPQIMLLEAEKVSTEELTEEEARKKLLNVETDDPFEKKINEYFKSVLLTKPEKSSLGQFKAANIVSPEERPEFGSNKHQVINSQFAAIKNKDKIFKPKNYIKKKGKRIKKGKKVKEARDVALANGTNKSKKSKKLELIFEDFESKEVNIDKEKASRELYENWDI